MMRRVRFIFLLFVLTVRFCGFSQSFLPVCKNFGVEDYTEDAEFQCAVSAPDGTIFFGSNYGVFVYKGEKRSAGKSWSIVRLPGPDIVRALYIDTSENRLYVGAQNDFGYFPLNKLSDSTFVSLRTSLPPDYDENTEVWHLFKQNRQIIYHSVHALYVGSSSGALKIIPAPENSVFHNTFRINSSTILINSLSRNWYFYRKELTPASADAQLPVDKCYSVLGLKERGKYLFFFRNKGVYKVSIEGDRFTQIKKVSSNGFDKMLAQYQLYGAIFNSDSTRIVLATLTRGALLLDYTGFLEESSMFSETQGANNILTVYGLYTDLLHNTWILGKNNLSVLPSDLSLLHRNFRGITVNGLTLYDDKLYATATNGLYSLDPKDHLFSEAKCLNNGAFSKPVLVNNKLFAHTSNELVMIFHRQNNVFPSAVPIKCIAEVGEELWIATEDGLYAGLNNFLNGKMIDGTRGIMQLLRIKNSVYALVEHGGLLIYNTHGDLLREIKLNKSFHSSAGARLFKYQDTLFISNLTHTYTLKHDSFAILDDSKVWLCKQLTDQTCVRFAYDNTDVTSLKVKKSNSPAFVNANAFMSLVDVNDAEYWQGNYYLATKKGLYVSKLLTTKSPEPVSLLKVQADTLHFTGKEPIQIPYKNSQAITVFCGLQSFYSSFDNTVYSYRLANLDTVWTAQPYSDFTFYHLSWGDYDLEVKVNYGNDQVSEIAHLHFTILKPWWFTTPAIGAWCLLFVLFIYAIVQTSVYRLKESKIRLEEIVRTRTAEVVSQKNKLALQKTEIENKNQEITDSINYARRIQNSLLKGEEELQQFMPGSFVVYLPKDIVSGDFYWFANIMQYRVLAVADCTGHGVPGAFMSMLGVAKLNELAARQIFLPHELLRELNKLILETLRQKNGKSDCRDGMDAAMICVDSENKKLYYAGANRPLFIVNNSDGSFQEIKPTKLPVGGEQYEEDRSYCMHEIDISKDISVYMFTDGYADQFGGPKGKKMRSTRLQEMLLKSGRKLPQEQKQLLVQNYVHWKGLLDQVDDVCVLGICFGYNKENVSAPLEMGNSDLPHNQISVQATQQAR